MPKPPDTYYQMLEERLNGLLSIVVARLDGPQALTVWNLFKNAGNLNSAYVEHIENLRKEGRYANINRQLLERL